MLRLVRGHHQNRVNLIGTENRHCFRQPSRQDAPFLIDALALQIGFHFQCKIMNYEMTKHQRTLKQMHNTKTK
ncbi:hypothetical protein JHK82_019349 [Glycine max]|nr:hypothetical protein JHK86_019364 [Glycine max]KAG5143654.1 hypothetical protein JHK82_019349 [Glycine max]KHN31020.1 hypothetical protein glysoja_020318 [Glycine soja]